MYIKKSVLVLCAIILIIVSVVSTVNFLNPFGFNNWENFITLAQVCRLINEKFYQDVESEKYFNNAIEGLVCATDDPYTQYFWGEDEEEFLEEIEGNYHGVGLYITNDITDNTISVVSAISGSPAEEAGITTGDKILKINSETFTGEQLSAASKKMKGERDTTVTLTILHNESGVTEDIELVRSEINIPSIEGEMLNNNIGRINISQFTEGTALSFEEKFSELKNSGMEKLIIDLRNNPGGILEEVGAIADMFINDGDLIVYTEDKYGERNEYYASGDAISIPIVILTNKGSASASEVLTGALKDYNIAYHIGEKTYGKGVVQAVYEIDGHGTLSLTTARYFTPNGICIHEEGITPDEVIEMDTDKYLNLPQLLPEDDEQLRAAIAYLNK